MIYFRLITVLKTLTVNPATSSLLSSVMIAVTAGHAIALHAETIKRVTKRSVIGPYLQ